MFFLAAIKWQGLTHKYTQAVTISDAAAADNDVYDDEAQGIH